MTKKPLSITLLIYFFVVQLLIAGALRNDSRWYLLSGINLLALLLIITIFKSFFRKRGKKSDSLLLREPTREKPFAARERSFTAHTEPEVSSQELEEKAPAPLSESNIEYIKTKINRNKRKTTVSGGGLYRLMIFLLALVGFGGILYMFWDTFDFFAVLIGAIGMMIAIAVLFKATNLWEKSIFSSLYFLLFLFLACAGLAASLFGSQYEETEEIKS